MFSAKALSICLAFSACQRTYLSCQDQVDWSLLSISCSALYIGAIWLYHLQSWSVRTDDLYVSFASIAALGFTVSIGAKYSSIHFIAMSLFFCIQSLCILDNSNCSACSSSVKPEYCIHNSCSVCLFLRYIATNSWNSSIVGS